MNWLGTENYRLKKMARLISGARRVLDVGCKDIPSVFLQNPELIGLDFGEAEMPNNYQECRQGDAMKLPAPFGPESFDAVHAGEILEHFEWPVEFLRGCYRTLRPGGMLVLSTPNPHSPFELLLTINLSRRFFYDKDNYRPHFDHVCLYPQRWLIRMLEIAGFRQVRLYSGGMFVPCLGLIPFPRPWCYETIATGVRPA